MKQNRLRQKTVIAVLALVIAGTKVSAETRQIIPMVDYQALVTDEQSLSIPGVGLLVLSGDNVFVGQYARSVYTDAPGDYNGDVYHAIDVLYDGAIGRHRIVSLFGAASDRPVTGGLHTCQAATVYGYEVVAHPRTSIVLGGGVAVSDFGIETPSGDPWPVIPVPFIRASYTAPLFACSFDFITGPNLQLAVAPEHDFNLVLDMRIDQYRDIRDLIYEVVAGYRFLSIGFKNDVLSSVPFREDEAIETSYYAVFATVDLMVLSVTAGYAFDSRLRHEVGVIEKTGDGFFLAAQVLLPLGGGGK